MRSLQHEICVRGRALSFVVVAFSCLCRHTAKCLLMYDRVRCIDRRGSDASTVVHRDVYCYRLISTGVLMYNTNSLVTSTMSHDDVEIRNSKI